MSRAPDERLKRLIGGDDLVRLRRRLRRHFEQSELGAPPGTIRLGAVSPREYEALASLMGRRPRYARSIQIDMAAIDAAIGRAGIAPSLKAVLERLDGPIVHMPTARAQALARWAAVADGARHPGLARLLQTARGLGLLKRLAKQDPDAAGNVRDGAGLVLQRLPVQGLPRAQIAAEVLGDAHALDAGQPTATLVLAVLRQDSAPVIPEAEPQARLSGTPGTDLPEEDDRTVWARAGVLVNELARPALFLNLPTMHGEAFAAEAGEPAYATLRRLLRSPLRLAVMGRTVYVCENPNLVAIAAGRLGARCAPLVCTDGMPAAAQRTLLAHLVRAGADLLYHGDFDWPGVRIANLVMHSFGGRPWRFSAGDYLSSVGVSPGRRLEGGPASADWDAALAPAMQERGLAIAEEAVAAALLEDLQV